MPDINSYASGRVQIKISTAPRIKPCKTNIRGLNPSANESPYAATIETVEYHFTRLLIAPFLCQSSIEGPNFGCVMSQWCSRSEDLEKKNAESNINGTVGNIGSNIPITPSASEASPNISQIKRMLIPSITLG